MSISAIRRTFLVDLAVSVLLFGFAKVYNLYGHGVTSLKMDYMFGIPLAGGVLFVAVALLFRLIRGFSLRPFRLLLHMSLATLTAWALLFGILEIAMADSPYLGLFFWAGAGFAALSLGGLLLGFVGRKGRAVPLVEAVPVPSVDPGEVKRVVRPRRALKWHQEKGGK